MINSTCPCCGYITLSERGGYEICPICFWEDDPHQFSEPDYQGGRTGVSLRRHSKTL
ncbi:CPCC family cysteine-rich protein [Chitinophaga alhagiae]|uniref:CPCC family cysteine-rich protein n=1 Tax=Chitinophaga alhagiae TaxID=2203219 RepID=UPI0018E57929